MVEAGKGYSRGLNAQSLEVVQPFKACSQRAPVCRGVLNAMLERFGL